MDDPTLKQRKFLCFWSLKYCSLAFETLPLARSHNRLLQLVDIVTAVSSVYFGAIYFILQLLVWILGLYITVKFGSFRFGRRLFWAMHFFLFLFLICLLVMLVPQMTMKSFWSTFTANSSDLAVLFPPILALSLALGLATKLAWFQVDYEFGVYYGYLATPAIVEVLDFREYLIEHQRSHLIATISLVFFSLAEVFFPLTIIAYLDNMQVLAPLIGVSISLNTVMLLIAIGEVYSMRKLHRTDIGSLASWLGVMFSVFYVIEAIVFLAKYLQHAMLFAIGVSVAALFSAISQGLWAYQSVRVRSYIEQTARSRI